MHASDLGESESEILPLGVEILGESETSWKEHENKGLMYESCRMDEGTRQIWTGEKNRSLSSLWKSFLSWSWLMPGSWFTDEASLMEMLKQRLKGNLPGYRPGDLGITG